MRVNIGKYPRWVGPYQITDSLHYLCIHEKHRDMIGDWLCDTWVDKLCSWIHSKKKRTIKVHVDSWDSWNADETMALLCLPILKQLRLTKHGACGINDEDVPEELRSYNAPPKENEWDTDANWFKRFDWVLDEIIWALENIVNTDWEDQFHKGNYDFSFVKVEGTCYSQMVTGPNHTHEFDSEGHKAYSARIDNGLRLLGVYWRGLWD